MRGKTKTCHCKLKRNKPFKRDRSAPLSIKISINSQLVSNNSIGGLNKTVHRNHICSIGLDRTRGKLLWYFAKSSGERLTQQPAKTCLRCLALPPSLPCGNKPFPPHKLYTRVNTHTHRCIRRVLSSRSQTFRARPPSGGRSGWGGRSRS